MYRTAAIAALAMLASQAASAAVYNVELGGNIDAVKLPETLKHGDKVNITGTWEDWFSHSVQFDIKGAKKGATFNGKIQSPDWGNEYAADLTAIVGMDENYYFGFKPWQEAKYLMPNGDMNIASAVANIDPCWAGQTCLREIAFLSEAVLPTGGSYSATVTITPIPGAVLLLGPALAGMGYMGWRKKQTVA